MSYENNNDHKELSPQEQLELRAGQTQTDRVIKEHLKGAKNKTFSSTGYGRMLVSGDYADSGLSRIDYLASLITRFAESRNQGPQRPSKKLIKQCLKTIDEALQLNPNEGREKGAPRCDRYGDKRISAAQLLAMICVKSAVDCAVIEEKTDDRGNSQWQSFNYLAIKIGDRVGLQFTDAACFLLDPMQHQRTSKRWKKAHQTGSNRRTNILLGQREIVGKTVGGLENVTSEEEKELAASLLERLDIRWSTKDKAAVGQELADLVLELDILEPLEPERLGKEHDFNRVKPTDALIETWLTNVLPAFTQDLVEQRPMVEPPIPWELLLDEEGKVVKGNENDSGGYHRPALRIEHPLVRGNNATRPSQGGVDFLNTLGRTGYKLDEPMVDSFQWAVDHRLDEAGIPLPPLKTVADLDAEGAVNAAMIEEHGHILDKNGNPLIKGTDAHNKWRAERRQAYDDAVDQTAKFVRTVGVRAGLNELKSQPVLHYGWSFDGRCRAYPQQAAMLNPQGTAVERSLLRFEVGEQIKEGSEAHDRVLRAIGVGWKGDKCSHAQRQDNGIEALKLLLPHIDQEDPGDISTVIESGAKDPWALLQLLRCYQRAFLMDDLWDVGIGADASQSGLQILSGIRRDRIGLEATNVLLPPGYKPGDPPVDGYRRVANKAKKMLMTESYSKDVKYRLEILLDDDGVRGLAKSVVLPLPYGSTFEGSRDAIRKFIRTDMVGDVTRWIEETSSLEPVEAWKLGNEVVNSLTALLRKATAEVYPTAMETMQWMVKVASKALAQQKKAGQMPSLHWRLHDGTVIHYWKFKKLVKRFESVNAGWCTLPIGDNLTRPDTKGLIDWIAPSFVHSLDAAILRIAFQDWPADRPLTTIHDCFTCLPSDMGRALKNLKSSFQEVCEQNTLQSLANGMGVDLKALPLGDAKLSQCSMSEFMFH